MQMQPAVADRRQVLTPEEIEALQERLETLLDKDLRVELNNRKITGKGSAKKSEKIAAIIFYEKQLAFYERAGIKENAARISKRRSSN